MLRNDAYVAVAFGDLKDEFGIHGAAAAAYRGESFAQPSYVDHLNEMVDAYAEARARNDLPAAEGIKIGLGNVLSTGFRPAIGELELAIEQNPFSSARPELERELAALKANHDFGVLAQLQMEKIDRGKGAASCCAPASGGSPAWALRAAFSTGSAMRSPALSAHWRTRSAD